MMTKRLEDKKVKFHLDIEVTHMVHDQIGIDLGRESKLFASWSNGDGTFTHHQVPCGDVTCSVCLTFATPKSMKDIYEQDTSSRNENGVTGEWTFEAKPCDEPTDEERKEIEKFKADIEKDINEALIGKSIDDEGVQEEVVKVVEENVTKATKGFGNVKEIMNNTEISKRSDEGRWGNNSNYYFEQAFKALKNKNVQIGLTGTEERPKEIHTQIAGRKFKGDDKGVTVQWVVPKDRRLEAMVEIMKSKNIKFDTSKVKPLLNELANMKPYFPPMEKNHLEKFNNFDTEMASKIIRDTHKEIDGRLFEGLKRGEFALDIHKMKGTELYNSFEEAIKGFDDPYQRRADLEGITRREAKQRTYEEHFQIQSLNRLERFYPKERLHKLGVIKYRIDEDGNRGELFETINKEDESLIRKSWLFPWGRKKTNSKGDMLIAIKEIDAVVIQHETENYYNEDGKKTGWDITYYKVVK